MNNHRKRIGKYVIYLNLKLGTGTFAEVFIGQNQQTKQQVAIKVVAKVKIQEDQYTKNAFFSEIQIMKKLKSSHIIKFLDVHQTKNNFYIILEKADETLRAKLHNSPDKKFDYKPTMKCLIQIMNGFGQLVKHGIIHRDLKPENILFKGQVLKIADFGFAKHSENNCFLNSIVGTPAYMAPQVLSKQKYTFKCDIWSLGVIVYEMLFGRNPWNTKQKNVHQFRKQVLTKKVTFPQGVEIPDSMEDFILGCLEIDEEKRFDWHKVFNHQIFGGKFIDNFKKQDTTKITFIMTNFRMNLHSKNINLNKIFSKLGKKISKSDFQNLIRFIYKEIADRDFDIIYSIVEKQNLVDIDLLSQLLNKYQCRMTGIDLSKRQMQIEGQQNQNISKNVFALMTRLKNCIEMKNINIFKLLYNKGDNPEAQVTFDRFCQIITIVDDSLFQNDLSLLFTQFKGNNQYMTNSYLYQIICKVAQIVPIEQSYLI